MKRTDGGDIVSGQVERVGNPNKVRQHEGAAGRGELRDLGNRKWDKEGRDAAGVEKEPGKSRGRI